MKTNGLTLSTTKLGEGGGITGYYRPGVLNAVRRSICLSILCLSSNCQKRGGDNRNWREALGGFTLEEGHEYYTLLKTRVNWIICLSKVFMLYNLTIKNYLMGLPPTHWSTLLKDCVWSYTLVTSVEKFCKNIEVNISQKHLGKQ